MSLSEVEAQNVHEISRREEAALRGVIVARDTLTGALLADSLAKKLRMESVTAQHTDLLRVLSAGAVGLVIISADLNSTPGAGVELAGVVSSAHPTVPIVILIDEPERNLVIRAFLSGARGVFNLQDPVSEFIDCVERVTKGSIWAGKKVTDHLLEAIRSIPALKPLTVDDSMGLTTRELQVVQCAARGKTNQGIADELHLSKHTVKNYLFKAFEKLHVSSRVELLFHLTMRGRYVDDQWSLQEAGSEAE